MPVSRKLSLCLLFCLDLCCIIAATFRAVQLAGGNKGAPPNPPCLALKNVIESSVGRLQHLHPVILGWYTRQYDRHERKQPWNVTVMVGCGPGFYRKVKSVKKSPSAFSLEAGRYIEQGDDSRSRRDARSKAQLPGRNEIPLESFAVNKISKSASRHAGGGSSKEELVRKESRGQITVTRSVMISQTREDPVAH